MRLQAADDADYIADRQLPVELRPEVECMRMDDVG